MPTSHLLTRRTFGLGLAAVTTAPTQAAAVSGDAMAPHLQALGWWMRRTTGQAMSQMRPFYEQVIGLPLVRPWENDLVLLWAGEDHIFEVKTDDNPSRREPSLEHAICVPVFRSRDLAQTESRLAASGLQPISRVTAEWGRTTFYRGPDGLFIGFEERAPGSPLPADKVAVARRRRRPARLGSVPPLPTDLEGLSRAIRRVADVPAMVTWYRDVFGLTPVGTEGQSALFALGEDITFEIAPGGLARPQPGDRSELPDSYVLRVHALDRLIAGLGRRGAVFSGSLIVKEETTRLQYVADPEGWLTGIEERGRIRPQYLEDVEADRRWRRSH